MKLHALPAVLALLVQQTQNKTTC